MKTNYKELLNQIRCFVFDVDGVLTNGNLFISEQGELLRTMHVKDGFAMQYALKQGYQIAIISGGTNQGVKDRLEALGITDVYLGIHDKIHTLEKFLHAKQLSKDTVAYMGDDIPDVAAMQQVLLPTCPQDAVPEVKKVAAYISHKKGGKGCVRDVIEQVLKVHGKWAM